MANITLTIGSAFKGEGFKKAQASVNALTKAVKTSSSTVSQLASTVGMLDAKYAQATNAITGMVQAISSGNPYIIAFQVAMTGIAAVQKIMMDRADKLNEQMKEMTAHVEKLQEKAREGFMAEVNESMKSCLDNAQKLTKEFDALTSQANSFAAAMSKIGSIQDARAIIQNNIDKQFALRDARPEDQGVVEAQYALKEALLKATARENANNDAQERVQQQIRDLESKKVVYHENALSLLAEIEDNNKRISEFGGLDIELKKKLEETNKNLLAQLQATYDEQDKVDPQIAKLKNDLRVLLEERVNIDKQNTLDRVTAENKVRDALDKKTQAELDSAKATKKAAEDRAKAEHAALDKQLNENKRNLDQANDALRKANANLDAAQAKWNDNVIPNMIHDALQKPIGSMYTNPLFGAEAANIQNGAAMAAANKGLQDGSIRSMKQLSQARKQAARAARDAMSNKQTLDETRDARELQLLEKRNPRFMTEREKQRLADLKQLRDAKNKDKQALEDAKKAKADAEAKQKEAAQAVIDIKKILDEKLGIK